MTGIYKITNKLNGKVYVGQSSNIANRISDHKYNLKRPEDKRGQSPLYDDMREMGIENFEVEIVTLCKLEELDALEEYYIGKFDGYTLGYNRTDKAVTTNDPKVMEKIQTEEVREQRRLDFEKMNKINWADPGYRKKMSEMSSKVQKERLKDPEYLKEKSEQLARHWRKKMKPVAQYTLDGDYIRTYEGVRVAERATGIHIHSHLKNPDKRKQAGGFVWKYVE